MSSTEIANLAQLAREAAATQADVPGDLARAIREAAAGPADPWVVAGVLIAGLGHMITTGLPRERRADCLRVARHMLWSLCN